MQFNCSESLWNWLNVWMHEINFNLDPVYTRIYPSRADPFRISNTFCQRFTGPDPNQYTIFTGSCHGTVPLKWVVWELDTRTQSDSVGKNRPSFKSLCCEKWWKLEMWLLKCIIFKLSAQTILLTAIARGNGGSTPPAQSYVRKTLLLSVNIVAIWGSFATCGHNFQHVIAHAMCWNKCVAFF